VALHSLVYGDNEYVTKHYPSGLNLSPCACDKC